MTNYIYSFDSIFWLSIGTMTFGFLTVILKYMLASKCDNLNICFGCISVHRLVELENGISTDESISNNLANTNLTNNNVSVRRSSVI